MTKLSCDVRARQHRKGSIFGSLEHAFEGIEVQLRSVEAIMVTDCLRHTKRFHATVSFIADTGLKDATANGTKAMLYYRRGTDTLGQ